MALTEKLAAIANAIRSKTGKTEGLTLEQMPGEIEGIETGGVSEQEIIDKLASNVFPSGDIVVNSALQHSAFFRKSKITSVHVIGSMRASEGAFAFCAGLKKAVIEKSDTGFAINTFNSCTALEHVVFRPVQTGRSMFSSCTALKRFEGGSDFERVYGDGAFYKCTALKYIILRKKTTMQMTSCFSTTSISSGGTGCNIYVPSALIEEQRAETNWAVFDAYGTITWKALEDYTIDGTTTGEMDWAKIEAEEVTA